MLRLPRLKRVLPYLLLVTEAVVFFRHVLFVPGYIIPWDLHNLHLPYVHFYAESLARGEFPLWDPYTYCGRPLFATIQSAVLYPAVAISAWLGNVIGRDRIFYLLELTVVLHVALAGIFSYLLGRRLGLGTAAALFGATVYELSGFFAAHAEHLGTLICAAWLPAAWYAVARWREERGRRPVLLLAAIFAMTFFSGHPPLAVFVVAFSVLFALCLDRSWRAPAMTCTAAVAALLLTAVQLVPAYELTGNSIAKYRGDYLKGGIPPQSAVTLLLPNHFNTFDPPHYNGPADLSYTYLYCGLLGVAMAAAGIVLARRDRLHLAFAIVLICAAAMSLADTTRVTHALYDLLPMRIQIALHPETATAPFTLCIAMLGALAVARLVPRRMQWAAVFLVGVDLVVVSSGRAMNAMPFTPDPAEAEAVARVRALTETQTPPTRIDTMNDSVEWAMSAPLTHIYTASGADVMAPERVMQARLAFCRGERWGSWYQVANLHSPVLGMMNVRYVLSPDARAAADGSEALPGRRAYQTDRTLPRFYLVTRTRVTHSLADSAAALRSADFRPAEEAIVEDGAALAGEGPPGHVQTMRYQWQTVELQVDAPTRQFLVSSETHYPGWRAWIDGTEQRLYYTNAAFRGLEIPAGRHTVRMQFAPAAVRYAAVLSAMAWLAWIVIWTEGLGRPGRRPEPAS